MFQWLYWKVNVGLWLVLLRSSIPTSLTGSWYVLKWHLVNRDGFGCFSCHCLVLAFCVLLFCTGICGAWSLVIDRLVGLVVKASASRAEGPGFESRLGRDFFGVESYQWLKNCHSSGYPARRLALQGQHWDWLARCQYTVTGWGRTLDLQLLSQCGST